MTARTETARVEVEHVAVGERAGAQHAAVGNAEQARGVGGHATYGVLDRVLLAVSYPMQQEPGREGRVHDQTDVRTGVAEPDCHAGMIEQLLDGVHALVEERV